MKDSSMVRKERLTPYTRGFNLTYLGQSRTGAVAADHGGADPPAEAEARGVEFPLAPFRRLT
jgi:hypothetical protein